MLFGTKEQLEERIIRLLGEKTPLIAGEIRMHLGRKPPSIQGVYKALRALQREGALVKFKKQYSLQMAWVLSLFSFTDSLSKMYLDATHEHLIPDRGQKRSWKFTNLLRLNELWSHLLLILSSGPDRKKLLGWNPHLWFHLVQTKQEKQYINALSQAGRKLYVIIGSKSFLDTWAATSFLSKETVTYSFGKSPFHGKNTAYKNIIGDYVLTVTLHPTTLEQIEELYRTTSSFSPTLIQKAITLFTDSKPAKITLEHHTRKAAQLRRKFEQFFGEKF
ncbi:MAG: hypothetical protein EXS51_00075 [Candidatus Taylorbacteria bacterium]|nr:hypothetical protein [Candidatus Taylorbacteria bacterium]